MSQQKKKRLMCVRVLKYFEDCGRKGFKLKFYVTLKDKTARLPKGSLF